MEVSFFAHAKALTRLVANDTAGLIAIEASRILGHTNITTTQIYAKITMNKIDSDMVELGKKLSTQSHIGYVER